MKMKATKRQSDEATKGEMRQQVLSSPSSLRAFVAPSLSHSDSPSSLRRFSRPELVEGVAPSLSRSGFSFTEVLFAVIILGIGFIMVAAMFPVAIQQTKLTGDEGHAATIARAGVSYLQQIATDANFPVTNNMVARLDTSPTAWNAIRGSLINSENPRYAFVPLYRRAVDSNTAQIFVIVAEVKHKVAYEQIDHTNGSPPMPNLMPRPVVIESMDANFVEFKDATTPDCYPDAAAEGAYLVVANDLNTTPPGYFNGRIYRLGARRDNPLQWDYYPGSEFVAEDPDGTAGPSPVLTEIPEDSVCFILGRASKAGMPGFASTIDFEFFEGPAQDVMIYTTFIQIQ